MYLPVYMAQYPRKRKYSIQEIFLKLFDKHSNKGEKS